MKECANMASGISRWRDSRKQLSLELGEVEVWKSLASRSLTKAMRRDVTPQRKCKGKRLT